MPKSEGAGDDEALRRQERLLLTGMRLSGRMGVYLQGPAGMNVVMDIGKNLAPEIQEESNMRLLHLSSIRPVPEMLAA